MSRPSLRRSGLGLVALLAGGCLTISDAEFTPSAEAPVLMVGAEHYFQVEMERQPGPDGRTILSGYIRNRRPEPAENVRLLVEALDAGGRPVGRLVRFLPGTLPGDGATWFEVRVPTHPGYRVSVIHWEAGRRGGGGS